MKQLMRMLGVLFSGWLAATVAQAADVSADNHAPAGFDVRRDGIAHSRVELIEYDSKTVGTVRKMQVYTPPG